VLAQEATIPQLRGELLSAVNPTPVPDDLALVTAARDGDTGAFGQLYSRYARMVHGILLARLPHDAVEDVLQEVFLAALKQLRSLREPGAFGGWLVTITRNRANDYYRRSAATRQLTEAMAISAPPRSEAAAVLEKIRGLPDAYRETLILRLVEGMTGPEIAARTGLTHGSVRVNLHRGMKMLKECLEGR
jgi:RNA polymerase sigma-70 factor (ECF subfamily)